MSNDFVNWNSTKNVKSRLYWAFEGIAFDIRNNASWHADWGKKPDSLAKQIHIAELFYKLIPIYSHRFLPASPCDNETYSTIYSPNMQ